MSISRSRVRYADRIQEVALPNDQPVSSNELIGHRAMAWMLARVCTRRPGDSPQVVFDEVEFPGTIPASGCTVSATSVQTLGIQLDHS